MKSEKIRISPLARFKIRTVEVDANRIHLLVDAPREISATQIVAKLKQESIISVWRRFPQILKRYFWKERTFWTDGYFVSTTGQAFEETMRNYIENQG